jgi:hypothetical protein
VLLALLERIGGGTEDMLRHAEVWKRLGERLHPGDYAKRYPKTLAAFRVVRDALPFQTFNRTVELALRQRDVAGALTHLRTRPGELARRIDHLSRLRSDSNAVDAFEDVAAKVSSPVLLQVLAHFRERNAPKELRTFFPKGDVGKVRAITNEQPALPEQLCQRLVAICQSSLRERYRQLAPLGRVFVDERLRGYTVPAGLRSASKALHTVARGSRIELPDGGTVRFFIWWKDGADRTDIDLSAIGLGEQHEFVSHIAYFQLRDNGGHHSGDITSAPEGAAEFIDVNIEVFRNRGIRYLVMCVGAYTHQAFCDLPECFAGFMMRQAPNSGEIFEARTVENKFDLTGRTRFALPMIIDLAERKVVWTDLALKHQPGTHNNVYNNLSSITLVAKAMTSLVKPDLYTLFRLHAEARGELVTSVDQADTIFASTMASNPPIPTTSWANSCEGTQRGYWFASFYPELASSFPSGPSRNDCRVPARARETAARLGWTPCGALDLTMSSASIICDTNIWYSVDSLIKTDPKANLCGTLINLLELCRTPWNLDSTEIAQVACKQLIQRNKGICVYSPMKSISVISGLGVDDGNEDQIRDCMTFIAGIAEGDIIKPEKLEVFRKMIEHEQQRLTDIAAQLNALVASVRSIGIDKRDPRRGEDMTATKQFVASMVGRSIKQEVTMEQIHWEEIELFLSHYASPPS